ncbi:Pycsar system effector family protein [Actinoplanes sp. NPDC049265]|uniref:Pycsar system effector family protein n=1 Tax=Actinoplanes sp. NPDC049265 TaxID=3363902 RepID=UPI003712F1D9
MAFRKKQTPGTDDAWRTLVLQIDLVKHAETKAAATLASSGVLGGLLFTLVSQNRSGGALFVTVASAAAIAVVTAAVAAGIALRPRLYHRHGSNNLLFYRTIARRYGHDAAAFGKDLTELYADRPALLAALAGQILSNANVATQKYRAISVAVAALLAALGLVAAAAIIALTAA